MKRLLKVDPKTGEEMYMHQNQDGTTSIEKKQNFAGLMELNKQMNNDWQYGNMRGTQRHMAHVAEIPNTVYNELVAKFGKPADNPTAWKKWLNDGENRAFRTGGGYL